MNNKKMLGTAVAATLLLATSIGSVMAQDTTTTEPDTTVDRTVVDTDRDDGFDDWGLLGLLGLLGLIPRKRHAVVHHDTTRTTTHSTTNPPR